MTSSRYHYQYRTRRGRIANEIANTVDYVIIVRGQCHCCYVHVPCVILFPPLCVYITTSTPSSLPLQRHLHQVKVRILVIGDSDSGASLLGVSVSKERRGGVMIISADKGDWESFFKVLVPPSTGGSFLSVFFDRDILPQGLSVSNQRVEPYSNSRCLRPPTVGDSFLGVFNGSRAFIHLFGSGGGLSWRL